MCNFVFVRYSTQISSIIVALVFLFTLNFKSFVTVDFYINQVDIAELFCINKEKPQLKCDGKCHLSSELSKTETSNNQLPFSQNSNEISLEFIFDIVDSEDETIISDNLTKKWFNFSESILYREIKVPSPPPKV